MRLKWAGHVERMGDETLAKRADVQKVGGKEMRKTENVMGGRKALRVGGEWRTTARDRRSWRLLMEKAVREK